MGSRKIKQAQLTLTVIKVATRLLRVRGSSEVTYGSTRVDQLPDDLP